MRADGSQVQKLAKYPGGGQISSCISWSPTGNRLAFDRDENIWTVKANGNDATRLTKGAPIDQCPSWSPDGKRIVFARSTNGNRDLVQMHVNGKHQQVVTTPQGGTGFGPSEPDWAPDGKRIAFDNGTGQGDIASIRPDGTGFKLLVATGKTEIDPAYSPNGKEIAYAILIDTHTTFVRRVSVNGGPATNLTPTGQHWFNPSWQPR
jgi:Tol biopolymer transport system component